MREYIEKRALKIADYIIETGSTVRAAAEVFKISKSSVHKDITERLREISPAKWRLVRSVLEGNLAARHIRGGNATRQKYLNMNGK